MRAVGRRETKGAHARTRACVRAHTQARAAIFQLDKMGGDLSSPLLHQGCRTVATCKYPQIMTDTFNIKICRAVQSRSGSVYTALNSIYLF